MITIKLTPYQARVLWGVVDGALDAGACEGGLEPAETEALRKVDDTLIRNHQQWRKATPPAGGSDE